MFDNKGISIKDIRIQRSYLASNAKYCISKDSRIIKAIWFNNFESLNIESKNEPKMLSKYIYMREMTTGLIYQTLNGNMIKEFI